MGYTYVIAPTYRHFQMWCQDTETPPHSARYIASPEHIRGLRHGQIVNIGWPLSWGSEQVNDAQSYLEFLELVESGA